jgi:general secretion pathway protein L
VKTLFRYSGELTGIAMTFTWRTCTEKGEWTGTEREGGLSELLQDSAGSDLALLVTSAEIAGRRYTVDPAERRHLDKLLPYHLESTVASDINAVHVARGRIRDGQVDLLYTDRRLLLQQIESLEALGLDIHHVYSTAALLNATSDKWIIAVEQGFALFNSGSESCTLDLPLLPVYLQLKFKSTTAKESELPASLVVLGGSSEARREVKESLSRLVTVSGQPVQVHESLADLWSSLKPDFASLVDLRQGSLRRPVRLRKYLGAIRVPATFALLALLATVSAAALETMKLNREYREIQAQIEQTYRQAVPEGLLVDAEQQLRSQLARLGDMTSGHSLFTALPTLAGALQSHTDIELYTLNYGRQQREIQLSVGAQNNSAILSLADEINRRGLNASVQNLVQSGSVQQATIGVQEGRL